MILNCKFCDSTKIDFVSIDGFMYTPQLFCWSCNNHIWYENIPDHIPQEQYIQYLKAKYTNIEFRGKNYDV